MVGRRYSHLNGTAFIAVIMCACLGTGGVITAVLFATQGHTYGVILALSTSAHSWWCLSRAWLRIKSPASGTMSPERKWGGGTFASNGVRAAALVWLSLAAAFHATFASSYGVWGDASPEHRAFAIWSAVATVLPGALAAELWPDTSVLGGGGGAGHVGGGGDVGRGGGSGTDGSGRWTAAALAALGLGAASAGSSTEERIELLSVAPAPSPPRSPREKARTKRGKSTGRKRRRARGRGKVVKKR